MFALMLMFQLFRFNFCGNIDVLSKHCKTCYYCWTCHISNYVGRVGFNKNRFYFDIWQTVYFMECMKKTHRQYIEKLQVLFKISFNSSSYGAFYTMSSNFKKLFWIKIFECNSFILIHWKHFHWQSCFCVTCDKKNG